MPKGKTGESSYRPGIAERLDGVFRSSIQTGLSAGRDSLANSWLFIDPATQYIELPG